MIDFPNAKINIGLHIVAKRQDGFHDVQTIMCAIPSVKDALEIVESNTIQLQVSGAKFEDDIYKNLVVQAHQLLQAKHKIPNVKIFLQKGIPHGAGLGGGSADAAYMLKMLNIFFDLKLSDAILENYASELGSDCAFFIKNTPAYATGRGEVLAPITLDLSKYMIALIKPNISINTAHAYANCKPQIPTYDLRSMVQNPITDWKNYIRNDFEKLSGEHKPIISSLKAHLYNAGALYAAMSGSGSTVYGIFEKQCNLETPKDAQVFWSTF
jgi:4-diphosphocytidyl-2-C-methyl-D-erythritol kinase